MPPPPPEVIRYSQRDFFLSTAAADTDGFKVSGHAEVRWEMDAIEEEEELGLWRAQPHFGHCSSPVPFEGRGEAVARHHEEKGDFGKWRVHQSSLMYLLQFEAIFCQMKLLCESRDCTQGIDTCMAVWEMGDCERQFCQPSILKSNDQEIRNGVK